MKISFKLFENTFFVKPYTTAQEKDILLWNSFGPENPDEIFDILNFNIDEYDLTEDEKKILIYKFREVSLGDEVNIKYVCSECNTVNENVIEANNFVTNSIRNDDDVKKLRIPVTDETLHKFVDVDVDELDIDEFETLKKRVKENQSTIDFKKECRCIKCGSKQKFNLGEYDFIFDIMSEDNLMSLYKNYSDLVVFGNYSKIDIDSMYPFERSILIGLHNQSKEELNK